MKLLLHREHLTIVSTIGRLYVDGVFECFILEDRYRPPTEPKVPGQTCVPNGHYDILINHSPRFGRDLPLLANVPGFVGIRIHPGNAPKDTEGCLLPGTVMKVDRVLNSKVAFDRLFAKLVGAAALGEALTIDISIPPKRS